MKKLIMVMCLIAVLTASSFAAEHPKKAGEHADSVEALIEQGFTEEEAETTVAQIVAQAKEDGLKGKEVAERVHAVVKAVKAIKEAGKAAEAKAEHPTGGWAVIPCQVPKLRLGARAGIRSSYTVYTGFRVSPASFAWRPRPE